MHLLSCFKGAQEELPSFCNKGVMRLTGKTDSLPTLFSKLNTCRIRCNKNTPKYLTIMTLVP